MGNLKKLYTTDKNLELEGVWVDWGDGMKMKIARWGNPEFKKVFRRLSKPYMRQIEDQRLPDEVSEELMSEIMSLTILVDWEGVEEDKDGGGTKTVKYSQQKAKAYLLGMPDFRQKVEDEAKNASRYQLAHEAAVAKN